MNNCIVKRICLKTNEDEKSRKIAAIAKAAELQPLPSLTNSSKSLGKSFKTPFISKNKIDTGRPLALTNSRPVKRSSDVHERVDEEDEDDMFISNQDLEALCINQSMAKRKKV